MKIIIVLLVFFLSSIRADKYAKDFITRYISALQSGSKDAATYLSKDFKLTLCNGETKWNREKVLSEPVFEKFGILNELEWDIIKGEGGKLMLTLDGFIQIEYVTKIVDSKLVIISERQFNCYEVRIGLHVGSKLFGKYKEAIRSKNQTMILETVSSKFGFNRRCRNDEHVGSSEFFKFLETLPTKTIPLHEASVIRGEIATDFLQIEVFLQPSLLTKYLLIWSEEKRTFLFTREYLNNCRNDNDYTSPLIDEEKLGKMIAEETMRKYVKAYKTKSEQRFEAVLSEGFITGSECPLVPFLPSTRDYRDFISNRLYEPDEPIIRNIEVDFFEKTVKAEVDLNDDSTAQMVFENYDDNEDYRIKSIIIQQCNITLEQSEFADKDNILQEAKDMEVSENLISCFADAIRRNLTGLLFKDIVSTPFTIIKNIVAKNYTETDFNGAELYPNPMPELEVVKVTRTNSGDLKIKVVAGSDISYDYRVPNVDGKFLITTEQR